MSRCLSSSPLPLLLGLLLFGLGRPAVLDAQEGGADEVVQVALPAKVDLAKLTDYIGDLVDVTVQYNPQRLRGETHLALRGEYRRPELWAIYQQVLAANGFATVLAGQPPVYQVVPLAEAAGLSQLLTAEQLAALRFQPSYVVLVQELAHLSAETATQMLTPLLSGNQGQIKTLGKGGDRILLAGLLARVEELRELLVRFDRPGIAPAFRQFTPQFAAPQKLQSSLQAAWSAAGRVRGSQESVELHPTPDGRGFLIIAPAEDIDRLEKLARDLDLAEPTLARSYRTGDFAIEEVAGLLEQLFAQDPGRDRLHIVRDQLTDALIITATTGQHERIAALIAELEAAPGASKRHMRSYPIKHRRASDMAVLLEELISAGGTASLAAAGGETEATAPAAQAGETRQTQPVPEGATPPPGAATREDQPPPSASDRARAASFAADDLRISVDEATNKLIVIATSKQLERIAELIEQLDRRQPQVELEIIAVNLTDEDQRELAIALAAQFQDGEITTSLASLLNPGRLTGSEGVVETLGLSGVSVVKPGDFGGLVKALDTLREGRGVVRSVLLADNNAEVAFNSVRQEPISSVNSGQNVATTSFAGTSDAGTQITITPTIGAGDHLTLAYNLSQSDFLGQGSETTEGVVLPPTRTADDLSGVSTIPDGHVIALGGLVKTTDSEDEQRVPILGSIPVLGWLFRSRTTVKSEQRIYFFIRASIMRHNTFEDLKYRSAQRFAESGEEDDTWPTLQARFID